MRKTRFTEHQIIAVIKSVEAGRTVKALNKSVRCRIAWLNKPQFHAMFKGPLVRRPAGKFRTLISPYCRLKNTKQCNTVQNAYHLKTLNSESDADR